MEKSEKTVDFLKQIGYNTPHADVAQLVELLICNQWVRGSSPCVGTILNPRLKRGFFIIYSSFFSGFLSSNKGRPWKRRLDWASIKVCRLMLLFRIKLRI